MRRLHRLEEINNGQPVTHNRTVDTKTRRGLRLASVLWRLGLRHQLAHPQAKAFGCIALEHAAHRQPRDSLQRRN
jgi:hypothetical protein